MRRSKGNVLEVLFARSRWAVLLVTPSLDAPVEENYWRNPGSKSVRIPPGSPPNYRSLSFRARLDVARVIVERRQGRGIPKALIAASPCEPGRLSSSSTGPASD